MLANEYTGTIGRARAKSQPSCTMFRVLNSIILRSAGNIAHFFAAETLFKVDIRLRFSISVPSSRDNDLLTSTAGMSYADFCWFCLLSMLTSYQFYCCLVLSVHMVTAIPFYPVSFCRIAFLLLWQCIVVCMGVMHWLSYVRCQEFIDNPYVDITPATRLPARGAGLLLTENRI